MMSDDVKIWLEKIGLGKYADIFSKNEIDFRAITQLSEEDLKELGLPLGARRNLQASIEQLSVEESSLTQASKISSAPKSSSAERRQLTVMFSDLVGSTTLSQKLDPENLRDINRTYQDKCKAAIERFDGYIARYMGDGVLAYFGYPKAHEDDAQRAIHAGLGIIDSIIELNDNSTDINGFDLGVRIGIATGPVVVGDLIGEGASQESAVVGETPNLAARLQTIADINSVVIGPGTHDLSGGHFEYEDLGAVELKGIIGAVNIWRVIGPSIAESHFEALHQTELTPLVGRRHEIGLLLERWSYAKEGDGQVVLLSGEPGIGKSRITATFRGHIAKDNPTLLSYQCSAYHMNSVLYPVIEQLKRAVEIQNQDTNEEKLKALESLISQSSQSVESAVPLFAHLLSVPVEGRYTPLEMSPERQKEATLEALLLQIEGMSQHRPVLLVFEDVHWADATSLELLGQIVSRAQNLKLLVLITFRPEFSPPWASHSHIASLTLSRLSRSQAIMMIDKVAGSNPIPEAIRDQIVEKTDGVPLFVEELTRTVIEGDLIEDQGDYFSLASHAKTLAIPSTLHDSLMARLDRSARVREVAQIAAVIGREFSYDLLATLSTLDTVELEDTLNQLLDAGLIFRYGPTSSALYVFKHALVQDAAYASLLKAKRKELHAQLAEVLESEFLGNAESEPELLAYHYTQAGLEESALKYWLMAGQRAVQQCAHSEAIAQLQRGLAIVNSMTNEEEKIHHEISFRIALGIALVGTEGASSQTVFKNYQRAQMLCEQVGDSEQLYPVLWGLWLHHFFNSELDQACNLADQLLDVGLSMDDIDLQLEAHHCQWSVRFVVGDLSTALDHCEKGIQLYKAEVHHNLAFTYGGHDPGVCARNVSGIALWLLGYPEQSKDRFDSAFILARKLSHSATIADALQMIVEVSSLQRNELALKQQAEELLEFAKVEKMFDNETLANGLIGWIKFQQGEVQAGLKLMRESVRLWLQKGIAWTAVPVSLVAESLGHVGEEEEGLRLLDEALLLGQRNEVHWWEAELYRIRGVLLLKHNRDAPSDAEKAFEIAIEIAQKQNAKLLELRAAVNLARLWKARGKSDKANDLLVPIYDWFTEGFDTADLRQAKKLIDELT